MYKSEDGKMIDLHIKTNELLEIHKYIGREGEDVVVPLLNGLSFVRRDNVCYISCETYSFKMRVNRMDVNKVSVTFKDTEMPYNELFVSRSKNSPF